MKIRYHIGLAAAGLIAVLSSGTNAAPLSQAVPSGNGIGIQSLIEPVHGCHRVAQDGYGGWHFHAGYDCRRVEAEHRERRYHQHRYHRRPVCRRECNYVGPIKVCKDRCY